MKIGIVSPIITLKVATIVRILRYLQLSPSFVSEDNLRMLLLWQFYMEIMAIMAIMAILQSKFTNNFLV